MIHPTAIIHPKAQVESSVVVGPYVVIDAEVSIGAECWIGPHVYLTGQTAIGPRNRFYAGCVIGEAPQDLKYHGEATRLTIGDENIFREHVTVHRSNKLSDTTTIGSNNFLMASSHVGHNTRVGNHVIIANSALLGGHVAVEDRAFISGTCMVHQFVRIGTLALMQGGAGLSKDQPPYTIAIGNNGLCGLNVIGLRRAGFTSEQRLELRRLYQFIFRSGRNLRSAAELAQAEFSSQTARVMIDFILSSKRGVCPDASRRPEESSDSEE